MRTIFAKYNPQYNSIDVYTQKNSRIKLNHSFFTVYPIFRKPFTIIC
ncbi:hypothetical protein GT694_08230 [Blautia massiliensis]|uniref:Uncharacterized protein n=1 Tax=Blautia massiliensis (ex Durand et al. 2017) TaxID=1737424 RepID=A0A6L8TD00_9FIRM|nr:hypothetical protein HMPREF1547_00232 [Blautia sp. KLE 1732]MZL52118.1 hypothetical protein [Blautia massiliensis (ex Durand et al. 2017)]MZL62038.1 hypothetical protein [Blautia massiliensis (ex Durand et al. 2017)]MZL73602.1 hypothetical protein [Blautia massiliensis (ex Durand et al. 2017)]MZL78558.1 hypothetical protein [Blautia massiliensis (ex Durand et al. 2017)]